MVWTDVENTLTSINEVNDYIVSMDCFHDYVVGGFNIKTDKIELFIEEECNYRNPKESKGMVWKLTAYHVSSVVISLDFLLAEFISEIEIEGNQFHFNLENGYIGFQVESVELRIPKKPGL